jgi:DNA-directed RNA polymerase subunit RPC12/RpoP
MSLDHTTPLKTCSKCGKEFPATIEYFYRNRKYLTPECKACKDAGTIAWAKANPERTKQNAAARSHRHYEANREKKREQSREGMRRWRAAHRDIHRLREHQRRQNLRGKPFDFTVDDWSDTQSWFEYKCAYCGRTADLWTVLAPDHVVPLVSPDCPGTIPSNIVPACHARKGSPAGMTGCNQSKNSRDLDTWLIGRFGQVKARKIAQRITEYQKGRRC